MSQSIMCNQGCIKVNPIGFSRISSRKGDLLLGELLIDVGTMCVTAALLTKMGLEPRLSVTDPPLEWSKVFWD
jgi:hypothetical protein